MVDVYVYRFTRSRGSAGEVFPSRRLATLAAIAGRGRPVMESQLVVDHTEVDDDGFFVSEFGSESPPVNELLAQIRSLERRANSRDSEARLLNETVEGARIYLLSLESRELRRQALELKRRLADLTAGEFAGSVYVDSPSITRTLCVRPSSARTI